MKTSVFDSKLNKSLNFLKIVRIISNSLLKTFNIDIVLCYYIPVDQPVVILPDFT